MAEFHDSLYYPYKDAQGNYQALTDAAPDKWIRPAGYGRFQICDAMGASRGVARFSGDAAPLAYVNPAHTPLSPDHYSMCAFAVPMAHEVNYVITRFDPARNAFYALSNIFGEGRGPWNGGGLDEQGAVGAVIYRVVDGVWTNLNGGAGGLHAQTQGIESRKMYPGALCVGDMDYWLLETWGQNPVKLRATIVQGGGQGVMTPLGVMWPIWHYGSVVQYGYPPTAFSPPEGPIYPGGPFAGKEIISRGAVVIDDSPDRILVGQPGIYGADGIETYAEDGSVGTTNGNTGFYAGDLPSVSFPWIATLDGEVASQAGGSAHIAIRRRPSKTITVSFAASGPPAAPTIDPIVAPSQHVFAIKLTGTCSPGTARIILKGFISHWECKPTGTTWETWVTLPGGGSYTITAQAENAAGLSPESAPRVFFSDFNFEDVEMPRADAPVITSPAASGTAVHITGTSQPGAVIVLATVNNPINDRIAIAQADENGNWSAGCILTTGVRVIGAFAFIEGHDQSPMSAYFYITVS